MNTKYFNQTLDGSDIPLNVGDRYYGQDRMRDFWNLREYSAIIGQGVNRITENAHLYGCVVTQGTGHTINISAGKVMALYQIKPPSSWSAVPPTMSNVDIPVIIEVPDLTDQSISGATTDSSTTNYVKLAYLETSSQSRARAKKSGSYDCEITPSYTLSCNSTPPTSYEYSIATFTSDGATLTFTTSKKNLKLADTVNAIYNDTDTDHDIGVIGGLTMFDSTGCYKLISVPMVKRIDASFSAGTGNGGLFTGSVANDTWYHFFMIRKDSDGSIDYGWDTDIDCANIPSGYTYYIRICSNLTDGSANILPWTQYGKYFEYLTPISNYATNAASSKTAVTMSSPLDVKSEIYFRASAGYEGVAAIYFFRFFSENETDSAPTATNSDMTAADGPAWDGSSTDSFMYCAGNFSRQTNTSSQIYHRASSTSPNLYINSIGYTDFQLQ